MKILYCNVIEQNALWGAEYFLDQGFRMQGAASVSIDFRKHRHQLSQKILEQKDFDVFFLQRGDSFPLEIVKAINTPRFFWASELLSRCNDHDHLLHSGLFDHIFVHSNACKESLVQQGWMMADDVTVLLNGYNQKVHRPIASIEKDIPVLFIGNRIPRRESFLDQIEQQIPLLRTKAYAEEMALYFNRADIVLNIHSSQFPDTETRIFEALGCGAFVISEPLSGESPFIDGEHLVIAENPQDFCEKIRFYQSHRDLRQIIADKGHQFVSKGHSYYERAGQLMDIFGRYPQKNGGSSIDEWLLQKYRPIEKRKARKKLFINHMKKPLKKVQSLLRRA